jgi:uncharacterized protein (TIGR02996 family)
VTDVDRAALLAACTADLDDDAPRLVWADAIGGERGELVVVQCLLERSQRALQQSIASAGGAGERAELARGERAVLWRRERELLGRAMEWSGLDGRVGRVRFRRGFVAAIELTAAQLRELGPRFRELAPFARAVAVTDAKVADLRGIVELARELALDGLHVLEVEHGPAWGDAFDRIVDVPLRALTIPGDGWYDFESTRLAATLEALRVPGPPDGGLPDLSVFPRLVALSAPAPPVGGVAGVRALEADTGYDENELPAILAQVPRLERLAVVGGAPRDGARAAIAAIAKLPALVELDLSRSHLLLDAGVARELAAARWPALRALRLGPDVARDELAAIVRALGPQLDVLDVRRAPPIGDDVLAVCAGDVLVDAPEEPELLAGAPIDWRTAAANAAVGRPCWLVHLVGQEAGIVRELHDVGRMRVGRTPAATVPIVDRTLGRYHAELAWSGDELTIRDLGSTNGTFVDNERCDHGGIGRVVPDGAVVLLGGHLARVFHGNGGAARARAVALALADRDPWTWLPRAAPADAARVRVANADDLRRNLGWIIAARARREIGARLVAAAGDGAAVFAPSDDEFAIAPASDATRVVAAAMASPVELDGRPLAVELAVASS